jgi:hypothetical protein
MGTVYRARDLTSGEPVALKVLIAQDSNRRRFAREAELLAELRHPGIVRYVHHGQTKGGELYLAMEWLEGELLADRLDRQGLTAADTARLGIRVAHALSGAHERGVVHRDLKPSNLFLVDGEVTQVKVLDFGIARLYGAAAVTATGAIVGTPAYMSPEQARGEASIDARADIFSLGAVLYRCLTGEAPFGGDDVLAVLVKVVLEESPRVRDMRPGVPPALDELIARMMKKDRAARPSSAAEVAAALEALGDVQGDDSAGTAESGVALTSSEQRVMCVVLARYAIARVAGSEDATLVLADLKERDAALREVVAAHGGRLESLADGSLVVTLRSTGAATDEAVRAARCAAAMRALLPDVPMALAAGQAVVAERTPFGDVIDRGARLLRVSTLAIRIDEVAARLLEQQFEVSRDADGLYLGGAREVGGSRTLLGRPSPCVGRDRDLAALAAMLDEVIEEQVARAVLITAPAGVGKSRLRHEFLQRIERGPADRRPASWLCRGDPMTAGSAFGMISQTVRVAAGLLDGEPLPVRQQKLRARVARHVAAEHAPRVTAFLGEMVGAPFTEEGDVQLRAARRDAILMGDQIRRAWEDWLSAEARAQPILMVLEDLHWGDLPSVKAIDAVLRNLTDQPIMVLALARPEISTLFPGLWSERGVMEVRLSQLSPKASEKLVREVLGDSAEASVVARIVELAAGNAFYLEELIRAVAERNADALPETVIGMVQARLDGLDLEARRILRGASIFGQAFWHSGVLALVGGPGESEVRARLGALAGAELVTRRHGGRFPGEDEYVFRHALVREVAYAMLTDDDRALGHRLAGEWLERAGEADPAVLAEHCERGGEPSKASVWYARTAEQALGGNDLDAAVAWARRGLACAEASEQAKDDGLVGVPPAVGALQLVHAEAHRWRGDMAEARSSALAAMEALLRGSPQWFTAGAEVATSSAALGDVDSLCAVADELARELAGAPSPAHVTSVARLVTQLSIGGKAELSNPLFAWLSEAVRGPLGADPGVAARVAQAASIRAFLQGDTAGYLERTLEAASGFEAVGDLRMLCLQRGNVGYAYLELGAHREAEEALRDALARAERIGLSNIASVAKHNLGLALAHLGSLDDARAVETTALQAFVDQRDVRMQAASRIYLAQIEALAGDLASAEREAAAAAQLSRAAAPMQALANGVLAHVRLLRGHPEQALASAREAVATLEAQGTMEGNETIVHVALAEAAWKCGHREEARTAIERGRQRLLARAASIQSEGWRKSFLERVPENARTLELAAAYSVSAN